MLGTAKVEIVMLIQTSASLFSEDYDDKAMRLMQGANAPGFTSAMAIGEALNALGTKRIALVSPYSEPVIASAKRYYEGRYGLSVVALEGFAATDSYMIGNLGPEMARDAFARIDRSEIEAFVVPGGNFPTMASIAGWERAFAVEAHRLGHLDQELAGPQDEARIRIADAGSEFIECARHTGVRIRPEQDFTRARVAFLWQSSVANAGVVRAVLFLE